jgi:hypothetical protein
MRAHFLSVVFRSVNDTVAKFDFRRDVLLFLSTKSGQHSPLRREYTLF